MKKYLQLIRWQNLLLVAFTMFFTIRFVVQPILGIPVFDHGLQVTGFVLLLTAVVLITAGGNIINDIFDVNSDSINKPGKNIVDNDITEKTAYILYGVFTIGGVLAGVVVSLLIGKLNLGFVFAIVAGLLYFYSQKYSCIPVLGNVVVSVLVSLSFGIVWFFYFYSLSLDPDVFVSVQPMFSVVTIYTIIYMIFAFLINLMREIVKDIEDYNGDDRFGCRTLPVVYGVSFSKVFAIVISVICVISCILLQTYWFSGGNYFMGSYFTIIDLLLIMVIVKLFRATESTEYRKISLLIKILMITGILSMILISFEF